MARAVLIVENADLWNAWANSALKGAFQSQQFLPLGTMFAQSATVQNEINTRIGRAVTAYRE